MVQTQLEVERTSIDEARKKVDGTISLETLYQTPSAGEGKWVELEGYVLLGLEGGGAEFEVGSPGSTGFILVTEEINRKRQRGEAVKLNKMVMVTYSTTQGGETFRLKSGDKVKVLGLATMLDLEFLKFLTGGDGESDQLPPVVDKGVKVERTEVSEMVVIMAKEVKKLSP